MPFKQAFERNMNKNMQGAGSRRNSNDDKQEEGDIKRHYTAEEPEYELEDVEVSEKKDRPPRFSTIFGAVPTPAPPPPPPEPYHRPAQRKSGVYIPMPLFVVLAIALFFESTLLFAYTIIGLYNNRPAGLLSPSMSITGCDCAAADRQSGVNIAPNFFMQPQAAPTQTVTVSAAALPNVLTSSTSSSLNTASLEAGIASKVESMLTTLLPISTPTPSLKVVTYTPPVPTTRSLEVITVNTAGSTLHPSTIPGNADPTPGAASPSKRASQGSSALASIKSGLYSKAVPSPSTLTTAVSSLKTTTNPTTTSTPSPSTKTTTTSSTTTSTATGSSEPCFGGAGAVALNCPGSIP